jgi:hypothetical protein
MPTAVVVHGVGDTASTLEDVRCGEPLLVEGLHDTLARSQCGETPQICTWWSLQHA